MLDALDRIPSADAVKMLKALARRRGISTEQVPNAAHVSGDTILNSRTAANSGHVPDDPLDAIFAKAMEQADGPDV
jgi:hypothetical protein